MFQYDFAANAGAAAELQSGLEAAILQSGWPREPLGEGVLVTAELPDAGRVELTLRFAGETGILWVEVPVATVPRPAPDGVLGVLTRWNEEGAGALAVALDAQRDTRVVLRRALPPNLEEGDPFTGADLRRAATLLAEARDRLRPAVEELKA